MGWWNWLLPNVLRHILEIVVSATQPFHQFISTSVIPDSTKVVYIYMIHLISESVWWMVLMDPGQDETNIAWAVWNFECPVAECIERLKASVTLLAKGGPLVPLDWIDAPEAQLSHAAYQSVWMFASFLCSFFLTWRCLDHKESIFTPSTFSVLSFFTNSILSLSSAVSGDWMLGAFDIDLKSQTSTSQEDYWSKM